MMQNELLQILYDDCYDEVDKRLQKRHVEREIQKFERFIEENYKIARNGKMDEIGELIAKRDAIYNDPEKLAAADAEIERRRQVNLAVLKKWGMIE